jgi:hypothetical protein
MYQALYCYVLGSMDCVQCYTLHPVTCATPAEYHTRDHTSHLHNHPPPPPEKETQTPYL